MQKLTFGLMALLLVSLAFMHLHQAHARVEDRVQIDQLHADLAALTSSLAAAVQLDALADPGPRPLPDPNWTYSVGDRVAFVDDYNQAGVEPKPRVVEPDGKVLLPEIGWVLVAGRSRVEVEALLTEEYQAYFVNSEPHLILVPDEN